MAGLIDKMYAEARIAPKKNLIDAMYAETAPKGGLMEFPKGLAASFVGAGKRILETTEKYPWMGAAPMLARLTKGPEWAEEPIEKMTAAEERLAPTPGGAVAKVARFAGEAGGTVAQWVAAGAAGGAPLVAAFAGTQGYQSAYDESKAAGESETKANMNGVITGAIDAVLGVYGADKLSALRQTGGVSMGGFVRNLRGRLWKEAKGDIKNLTLDTLKSTISGALTMAGFSGADLGVPAVVSQRWPKKEDGSPDWGQIIGQVGGAALGGGIMAGMTTLGSTIPRGLHEAALPTQPKILGSAKDIQEGKFTPFEKARSLDDLKKMMPTTGVAQTAKPSPAAADPFAVPENVRQTLEVADRIKQDFTPIYTRKGAREQAAIIKEKRGEVFAAREEKIRGFREQGLEPQEVTRQLLASEKGLLRKILPEFKTPYTTEDINRLQLAVQETNILEGTKNTLYSAFNDMFVKHVRPPRSRIKAFDKFFGTNILAASQGRPEGAIAKVADVCNSYKAVRASYDHSMVLRQGIWLFQNHPLKGIIAAGKGARALASKEYYQLADINMKTQPYWQLGQDSGLPYTEVGKRLKSEEQFLGDLAHRGKIGIGVSATDRAATTFLNQIRQDCWNSYCRAWEGHNKPSAAYRELADYLAHATGRMTYRSSGRVQEWFKEKMPTLNAIFWAPQLTIGTVQTHMDLITKPHIRKIVAGDMLQFYGQSLLALTLVNMIPGIHVEANPLSTDFGKVRCGNIRVDFLGARTQLVRMIAQTLLRKKKLTASEQVYNIKWQQPILQFLRSKLAPVPQIGLDFATGKTFTGRIARWGEPEFLAAYAKDQIPPLVFTDIMDAIQNNGLGTATAIAPMAFFGIGTQVYEDTSQGTLRQTQNGYAHEIFGCDWNDLGPEAQDELRRNRPLIKIWEDKAKYERENYDIVGKIEQESAETGRRILRGLSTKIQKELGRLEIKLGNIPRRMGSDWYLNEKRFNKYEKDLRETLNKVLTETISQPGWNEADSADQKLYLEQIIKDVKTYVRGQLVETANDESRLKYEDLEKVQQ